MRRLTAAALAVAAALVIVAAFVVWLLTTQSGLRAAWPLAARFSPVRVDAAALEGRLIGPLALGDVMLETDAAQVSVRRIELDWRATALLKRTMRITRLQLADVELTRRPGGGDGGPPGLPGRLALPVNVEAERVAVDGLSYRAEPGAAPRRLDSVSLGLRLDEEALRVRGLDVSAPELDVGGAVEVEAGGDYRVDAELDWTFRPEGRPELRGATSVSGPLERLVVSQRLASPYDLDARLRIADPLGELELDGELELRVDPRAVGFDGPVGAVEATASFAGGLDGLELAAEAVGVVDGIGDVALSARMRWLGDALAIDGLRLARADSPASLELAGRVGLAGAAEVELTGQWASLQWPLDGSPVATSPSGSFALSGTGGDLQADLSARVGGQGTVDGRVRRRDQRIDAALEWRDLRWPQGTPELTSARGVLQVGGTLDAYVLSLDAALAADGAVEGDVRAEGRGDRDGLELSRLVVDALGGALDGRGRITWAPVLAGEVQLSFERLDPSLVHGAWTGRVDGRVNADARVAGDELSLRVGELAVTGELRGRAVELDASGRYRSPRAVDVERLSLRSGASSLTAAGTLDDELDFEWSLDVPDLEDLWPGASGRLTSTGRVRGEPARPFVDVDASAAELAAAGVEIGALDLAARVDASGARESELELSLREAVVLSRSIERLDASGSGGAASHSLEAALEAEGAEADIALTGSVQRPGAPDFAWDVELGRARAVYAELEPWTLRGPAAARVTAGRAELSDACWLSGTAELCMDAVRSDGASEARFTLRALPFAYFAAYLPDGAEVAGSVDASGELELRPDGPRLGVELDTSAATVGRQAPDGSVAGLAFARGHARLDWDGARLDARLDLPLRRRRGGLALRAGLRQRPGAPLSGADVDGVLRAELDDLGFLGELVRGVGGTAGAASMDVELSGTLRAPRLVGRVALENGRARLRGPGVLLEDLRISLTGDGDGAIAVEAAARSGGGDLSAAGALQLDGAVPVGRIDIDGNRFELFNTPDARVLVSPDLRLGLTPSRLELTGEVVMPSARLTPRELTEGAAAVSEDQIIVDAGVSQRRGLTRPLQARVNLALGDDVLFDGFGLNGRLAGALEIVETPGEPLTGSGELRVEAGTYEAYGQTLQVRTGRLLFAGGALSRPGLDIEAVRRPTEDILVGARVRGTLSRPELSVFSEPSMPRQEQLSYLLLGRPLETTTTSETSELSRAAMALGLRGGNFVSDRLNEALGFDEFGIRTRPAADNQASFVIGKYLSPSLYVSYGIGLFEPVNTLQLRYTISSRWRLVTESSTEASGGDLIYHIERGN